MMNLEQACLVCDALDCTLDELVGRTVSREYTDAGQETVNICYESMNDRGKETLVSVAQSMERDSANRIDVKKGGGDSRDPLSDSPAEDVA